MLLFEKAVVFVLFLLAKPKAFLTLSLWNDNNLTDSFVPTVKELRWLTCLRLLL